MFAKLRKGRSQAKAAPVNLPKNLTKEERQWLDFAKRAARIGIENACLLDLETGIITGNGGSVVIDEELLAKIAFIKEGEFVETKGKPALRLIGDIQGISAGKVVVSESERKVVKAIEPGEIVRAFLENRKVDEPLEYLKVACGANSAYFPVFFLLRQASITTKEALEVIDTVTVRGQTKDRIRNRLGGKRIPQANIPTNSKLTQTKTKLRKQWIEHTIQDFSDKLELKYCLDTVLTLNDDEILTSQDYLREKLLIIFNNEYESATSALVSSIRNAICRVDEVINGRPFVEESL